MEVQAISEMKADYQKRYKVKDIFDTSIKIKLYGTLKQVKWLKFSLDRFTETRLILIKYVCIFNHVEKHNDNLEYLAPLLYLRKQNCPYLSYISVATVELTVYRWYSAMLVGSRHMDMGEKLIQKAEVKETTLFHQCRKWETSSIFKKDKEESRESSKQVVQYQFCSPFISFGQEQVFQLLQSVNAKWSVHSPCSTPSGAVKSPILFLSKGSLHWCRKGKEGGWREERLASIKGELSHRVLWLL